MIAFNNDKDLISVDELNKDLKEQVLSAIDHLKNAGIHISDDDRKIWNSKLDSNSPTATQSDNGLFSKYDKIKLDGIATNANNYTHPKSGVIPGKYNSVTVDSNGHILIGETIDSIDNAEKLGGIAASKYLKEDSPVIKGTPTLENNPHMTDDNAIADVKFVKDNFIQNCLVFNTSAPTDTSTLWYDTINKVLKYHNGTDWVGVEGGNYLKEDSPVIKGTPTLENHPSIGNDSAVADVKFVKDNFIQNCVVINASAPTDTSTLWYDTINKVLKYHNGTDWVGVEGKYLKEDSPIIKGTPTLENHPSIGNDSAVADVKFVKDNFIQNCVVVSDTQPNDTSTLWYDSVNKTLKYHNGTDWVAVGSASSGSSGSLIVASLAPDAKNYSVWLNSDTNKIYYSANGSWVDNGGIGAITYSAAEPTDKTLIWVNMNNQVKIYDKGLGKWITIASKPYTVSATVPDDTNTIWIDTNDLGIKYYKDNVWKTLGGAPFTAGTTSDRNTKSFWINYDKFNPDKATMWAYYDGAWRNVSSKIIYNGEQPGEFDNKNCLWIGKDNILRVYDRSTGKWVPMNRIEVADYNPDSTFSDVFVNEDLDDVKIASKSKSDKYRYHNETMALKYNRTPYEVGPKLPTDVKSLFIHDGNHYYSESGKWDVDASVTITEITDDNLNNGIITVPVDSVVVAKPSCTVKQVKRIAVKMDSQKVLNTILMDSAPADTYSDTPTNNQDVVWDQNSLCTIGYTDANTKYPGDAVSGATVPTEHIVDHKYTVVGYIYNEQSKLYQKITNFSSTKDDYIENLKKSTTLEYFYDIQSQAAYKFETFYGSYHYKKGSNTIFLNEYDYPKFYDKLDKNDVYITQNGTTYSLNKWTPEYKQIHEVTKTVIKTGDLDANGTVSFTLSDLFGSTVSISGTSGIVLTNLLVLVKDEDGLYVPAEAATQMRYGFVDNVVKLIDKSGVATSYYIAITARI